MRLLTPITQKSPALSGRHSRIALHRARALPSAVPGTEILADAEGQAAEAAAAAAEMEENRQRMAALKESLLSNGSSTDGKAAVQSGTPSDAMNFELPEVKLPELKLPEVNLSVGKPEVKVNLPEVSLPKVDIELPDIAIPVPDVSGIASNVTSSLESYTRSTSALVDKEIAGLIDGLRSAGDTALSQVPPEIREQAARAVDLLGDSIEEYNKNPEGYSIVLGVVLGLPLLLAYSAAYGGYSGTLKPSKVVEMLQKGDAVLVDVRKPEERKQDGVPLLKLAARGKGVALPLPVLSPSVSRQVSNTKGLATEILGQQIRSLSKLNPQTKVIIMDRKGEMAKDIARACRAAGVRGAYVMDGGFNNYRRQEGMAVDGKDFYEEGPLALAGDQVESLTSGLKGALSDRKSAGAILGAVATTTFVCLNLHEVLKFVGVLGIEATVVLRYVLGEENIGDDFLTVLNSLDSAVGFLGDVSRKVGGTNAASSSGEQPEGN